MKRSRDQFMESTTSTFGNATFDPAEHVFLRRELSRNLGPEFVSERPAPGGGKVAYIEAPKAIQIANDMFGFNGWSSTVMDITVDFVDVDDNGRSSLGLSAIVRVTLKDGAYHEDVGYGSMINARDKASAFEKAKKEAVTDAIKRALRSFGNSLGNCLYDKVFTKALARLKAPPAPGIDPSELYRADHLKPASYIPRPHPQPNNNNMHMQFSSAMNHDQPQNMAKQMINPLSLPHFNHLHDSNNSNSNNSNQAPPPYATPLGQQHQQQMALQNSKSNNLGRPSPLRMNKEPIGHYGNVNSRKGPGETNVANKNNNANNNANNNIINNNTSNTNIKPEMQIPEFNGIQNSAVESDVLGTNPNVRLLYLDELSFEDIEGLDAVIAKSHQPPGAAGPPQQQQHHNGLNPPQGAQPGQPPVNRAPPLPNLQVMNQPVNHSGMNHHQQQQQAMHQQPQKQGMPQQQQQQAGPAMPIQPQQQPPQPQQNQQQQPILPQGRPTTSINGATSTHTLPPNQQRQQQQQLQRGVSNEGLNRHQEQLRHAGSNNGNDDVIRAGSVLEKENEPAGNIGGVVLVGATPTELTKTVDGQLPIPALGAPQQQQPVANQPFDGPMKKQQSMTRQVSSNWRHTNNQPPAANYAAFNNTNHNHALHPNARRPQQPTTDFGAKPGADGVYAFGTTSRGNVGDGNGGVGNGNNENVGPQQQQPNGI
ncbi:hypothetical protein SmJEL517_g05835 [Synchytrium microbalum]|uniref:Uncharacterized protein n=1 Tax=Synchytrium microbalum TaxID=1806994 RepID=A0A507BZE2_9FUNG|nr:uncharacterized protein SmJEL517_g05835 [Synchytrium microbalum]TPX30643.1 hypothetical protein SmJEL517_g05835 [Synchytrium microbalum]